MIRPVLVDFQNGQNKASRGDLVSGFEIGQNKTSHGDLVSKPLKQALSHGDLVSRGMGL